MIIDIHAHIWGKQDIPGVLKDMDFCGVDKAYLSCVTGWYPTKAQIEENNRLIADTMRAYPDRFGGAVYINPTHDNTMDVIKRGLDEQGMSLIKFWVATYADDPCMDPVMEYAADNGIPVLIHAFRKAYRELPVENTGRNVAALAARHPKTKILMAHLGGSCYDGVPAVRDCPNVWLDYSGSYFTADAIDYAVEMVGAERLLYGSDMPANSSVNIGKILGANLTEAQRWAIFRGNAERLLDRSFRL